MIGSRQVRSPASSNSAASDTDGQIPFRVRLGVTGHRELGDRDTLATQIRERLIEARDVLFAAPSEATPVVFTISSALAEGADRLVAQVAMDVFSANDLRLEAVLPLSAEDYVTDFKTDESRQEFTELLARAQARVELAKPELARPEAYERAGRYIVDRCDLLIAVWDGGLPRGRGGTAEIVDYARSHDVAVLVVPVEEGSEQGSEPLTEPAPTNLKHRLSSTSEALARVDAYNTLSIQDRRLRKKIKEYDERLRRICEGTSVHWQYRLVADWALPRYARADVLAIQWQTLYRRLTWMVHCLAALAVTVVAAQVVWAPTHPAWLLFEVTCLIGVIICVLVARGFSMQGRWVGYRSLAEAFRSGLFIALTGVGPRSDQAASEDTRNRDDAWFQRAFSEAWSKRTEVRYDALDVRELRRLLVEGWLDDQILYHRAAEKRYERDGRLYLYAVLFILGLALGVALVHAINVIHTHWVSNILVTLAISLPAWGAALAGLREQSQPKLHEERSRSTARRLERLKDRSGSREDLDEVRQLAADTQDVIVQENLDWFGAVELQELEVTV